MMTELSKLKWDCPEEYYFEEPYVVGKGVFSRVDYLPVGNRAYTILYWADGSTHTIRGVSSVPFPKATRLVVLGRTFQRDWGDNYVECKIVSADEYEQMKGTSDGE